MNNKKSSLKKKTSNSTEIKVRKKKIKVKSKSTKKAKKNINDKSLVIDKVFLKKMLEDLLPQMTEKILVRAKLVGQLLRKRK